MITLWGLLSSESSLDNMVKVYELSVPTGLLKEMQISTLNNNGIFCMNNKYFNK